MMSSRRLFPVATLTGCSPQGQIHSCDSLSGISLSGHVHHSHVSYVSLAEQGQSKLQATQVILITPGGKLRALMLHFALALSLFVNLNDIPNDPWFPLGVLVWSLITAL